MRGLVPLLGIAAIVSPPAQAGDGLGMVGLHLSVTPGDRIPIGLGLEGAFGNQNGEGFTIYEQGFAQIELRSMRYLRVALGARLGMGSYFSTGGVGSVGELDFGVAFRSTGGHGLHTGLGFRQRVGWDNTQMLLRADHTVAFDRSKADGLAHTAVSVGAAVSGVIDNPNAGPAPIVDGRPVRVDGEMRLPVVLVPGARGRTSSWLERGRTEQASVPAFLQLAAELRALGAPQMLVGRALSAARDEVRHARLCYAMAAAELGRPILVGASPGWTVRGGNRTERLSRIARESLNDGIIGEGDAAKRARSRRDAATHDRVARVEHTIVVEESRHAALAKDLVVWAKREGARREGRA